MMDLDITFSETDITAALEDLRQTGRISASRLLALLEGESEDTVEEAMAWMDEHVEGLDVSALPNYPVSPETAARLRLEEELVRSGQLMTGLPADDYLALYLQEIAQLPAAGDPDVLAMELLEGRDVKEQLAMLMLSRVIEAAQELVGHNVLLVDLIQEGGVGLWQGICSYTGGDITASCDRLIRLYMEKAVTMQARAQGLGQKLKQGLTDYVDVDRRLLAELGRNPTIEEIAGQMHVPVTEASVYGAMLERAHNRRTVEAEREAPEESPEDQQAVEDTAYFQTRQTVDALLSGLNEEDRQLLTLRYGLEGGKPMPPEEVGRRLGLSPEEAVRREADILAKLKKSTIDN